MSLQCQCPLVHRREMLLCSPVPGHSRQQNLHPLGFRGAMATPGGGSRAGGNAEGTFPLHAARVGHVDAGQEPGGRDGKGGDTGEGGMVLTLRGLGWVCLASDAPSTLHPLGGFLGSRSVTAGETPWGRCPPALCQPQTRRATGVTPRQPRGHPAPKPAGPSATGGHQSCHQVLLPCSSLSSDASALPSRGCAAWHQLLATAGCSRGVLRPFPSLPLLPPLPHCPS